MLRTIPTVLGLCLLFAAPLRAVDSNTAPPPKIASVTFPADGKIDFVRDVQPIFKTSCVECHSADNKKGRLRLDAKQFATAGGQSGVVVVAGKPGESVLLKRVRGDGGEKQMPFKRPPLPAEQIRILTAWVEQGAIWPDGVDGIIKAEKQHWSFVKPVRHDPPVVKNPAWVRNPIDAFVLARLEREGLRSSAEADRAALIRRVTLDLTGLPPTLAEIDAFVADPSPNAYEKLVDRLLASSHYGERWARLWLDAARFADTNGYEKDRPRNVWPYRDWVINALNGDMPFDQFTIEQIAGDMLPNATTGQIVATGFHRNTLWNEEGGIDLEEFRFKAVVDRIETTGKTWLGLTLQCGQCHNHKYDPLTQKEYYGLFAMLNNADEPELEIPDASVAAKRAAIESQIAVIEANLASEFPADDPVMSWTTLTPAKLSATSGATLTVGAGGVVFASGKSAETDAYTLNVTGDFAGVTAFRLEALADPSLPHNGPGRAPNGNFVVSEVKTTVMKGPKGKHHPLTFRSADADVAQKNFDAANAIDGNASTGWAVDDGSGNFNRDHALTLTLGEPLPAGETKLAFQIEQQLPKHALGRFRISAGRPAQSSNAQSESLEARRATRLESRFAEWQQQAAAKAGRWTVVRPGNMTSRGRATMTVQDDGSVLVSGDWPNNDVYTLDLQTPQTGITAIKLEVLPDHSLPEDGPGRAPLFMPGDFLLSEFELKVADVTDGELRDVKPASATHSFASQDRSAQQALDGKVDTGWSISPRTGEAHQAVFVLPSPVGGADGTKLQIRLVSQYIHQMTIGRFRISVTSDAKPAPASDLPPDVEQMLATTTAESRTPEQNTRLKTCFLSTTPDLAAQHRKITELRKSMPKLQRQLVMRERLPQHARVTTLFHRGEFLQPRESVAPATPGILHPLPAGAPANRLGLAKWLVDENNPLMGRVVMNRVWAAFFGRGIVNTVEDFGLMGEPPSHSELLDWLATEFFRQKLSMKAMHRLIVTSATYRQSGRVSPELLTRDPGNVMLARGPRNRVEAEMVRDLGLAVSGLLTEKVGGPSVYPPQPDGVSELSYGGGTPWPTSTGPDRWRRGMYTYLKRTTPYPAMLTFDAPSSDTACVRRVKSNTPLQALTLLNDKVFVEASQALARRVLKESAVKDDAARAKLLFRLCTGRDAEPDEVTQLTTFRDAQLRRFKESSADALAIAASEALPMPTGADASELASWTVLARAMLNLDETITK